MCPNRLCLFRYMIATDFQMETDVTLGESLNNSCSICRWWREVIFDFFYEVCKLKVDLGKKKFCGGSQNIWQMEMRPKLKIAIKIQFSKNSKISTSPQTRALKFN